MKLLDGAASIVLIASLAAEHAPIVERGVVGLRMLAFAARNAGAVPMSCGALIAHWYSLSLGSARPGGKVEKTLWFDPVRGAIFIMTKDDVRLPVEVIWCGLEEQSWKTRFEAVLPRQAGDLPQPITLNCASVNGRLQCR